MTDQRPTDALVGGVKIAVVHFGKAAFEVAAGVGALFVGITQTVRNESSGKDPDDGRQKVTVE